jgi:hypothetical protein
MTEEYVRRSTKEVANPLRFEFEADTPGDARLLADLQFGEGNYSLWQIGFNSAQWVAEPAKNEAED